MVSYTAMAPNSLLMAKLCVLFLAADGFIPRIGATHTPALAFLDFAREVPAIGMLMLVAFLAAGCCLLFNIAVRSTATIAGALALLTLAQALPAYRAEHALCASILLLCGLQGSEERAWLVRLQVVVALMAIVLSRMKGGPWVDEVVLENWIQEKSRHPVFVLLSTIVPGPVIAEILSSLAAACAAVLGLALFVPRFTKAAVCLALASLLAVYFIIGTRALGGFSIVLGIGYLSFLNWPRSEITSLWPRACGWPLWMRIALDRYDWDRRIDWPLPEDPDGDLEVTWDGNKRTQWAGACALIAYFPAFYFAIFVAIVAVHEILPVPYSVFAHGVLAGLVLLFFAVPPVARRLFRKRKRLH